MKGGSSETRGGGSSYPEDSQGEGAEGPLHKGRCLIKGERLPALQAGGDITGLLSPTGVPQEECSWLRQP